MKLPSHKAHLFVLSCVLLGSSAHVCAQDTTDEPEPSIGPAVGSATVSPEAQAVLERMTAYLQGLTSFSVETDASRDEVVALGYKLQNNEHSQLVVQRPDKLRAEVSGDVRNRTFVYDGKTLVMYSPDDKAYVRSQAPDTIGSLLGGLLDAGVEMPLIDVLYQGTAGTLTDWVRGGILVGTSTIDGIECDQLAFRQASIDWQLWVQRGDRPLPMKILITTRYEVGDPQYEATLRWNLKPRIDQKTFSFAAPRDAIEIPLDNAPLATASDAP